MPRTIIDAPFLHMTIRNSCLRFYLTMRRRITPTLTHAQDAYAEALKQHVDRDITWLDVGCGHQVLPDWLAADEQLLVRRCGMVVGVDASFPSVREHQTVERRVVANISQLPFPDGRFDLVTANMVVEHLEDPVSHFRELSRVLKPSGVCLLLTPNAHGYPTILARRIPDALKRRLVRLLDGRSECDVFRTFYRANTPEQLREVADASDLHVSELALVTTEAVGAVIPPVAIMELLWIRLLMTTPFRQLRPNLLAALRKQPASHT